MRFLAAHEVDRRLRQLPVLLPEIGKHEAFDLPSPLRLVEPMNRGVLRPVKGGAENAEHACKNKLAWRVLSQAIASRTADDGVDGNDIEADFRRSVGPQAPEPQVVVDAAVGE